MTVNLSMLAGAGAQFFDSNGTPLSGGKLYSYQAGTTTPQATYTTSAGNVAHANPIVLDSAGRVPSGGEIWLTDAVSYKFVLNTSTDVLVATYDNITGNSSGVFATLAASSGSSLIGFIQSGGSATATTVQNKLRQTVSIKDFGAVANGIADDKAAVKAALESGFIVDGGGLTYGISGTLQPASFVGLRNANFIQLSPTTSSVATLYIYALSNWFIENCSFDMGSVTDTGASDDSSKSALRVRNVDGTYCENFRISNVTVTGDGNGSRIQVRESKRFVIENCLVRDCLAGATPDPTNDIMNAYDIGDCANFTMANCNAYDLQCILSGVPANRYTRGFLFTEVRDCSIIGCNSTLNDQCFDFSGAVISGTTPAYYQGNRRFTLSGCTANTAGTWGFKFANVTHDGVITGCIANNAGSGGFIASAPTLPTVTATYATSNLDFIGCKVVNVLGTGAAGAGNAQGFRASRAAIGTGFDTYPRGIRFIGCEVMDNQSVPTTAVGFASDVNLITYPTAGYNTNIANTATNCSVASTVTTAFSSIGPTCCYVTGTSTQSIPNATWTYIDWDNNGIDNSGLHSTVSNNNLIYIKEPGTYQISTLVCFVANATGVRGVRISKNGAPLDRTVASAPVSSAASVTTISTSIINDAAPGDYYGIEVTQNTGGALTHQNNEAHFIVQKIG